MTTTTTTYLAAICLNKAPSTLAYLHADGSMLFAKDGAIQFTDEESAFQAAKRAAVRYADLDVTPGPVELTTEVNA